MKSVPFEFRLKIGDWSDDGHGKVETFDISSSHSVKEVREFYFTAIKNSKFDISKIAHDYDSAISDEQVDKLIELGVPSEILIKDPEGYHDFMHSNFAKLFCWFTMKFSGDDSLKLFVVNEEIDMFHFYGFDSQKRHIGAFGYGLFT